MWRERVRKGKKYRKATKNGIDNFIECSPKAKRTRRQTNAQSSVLRSRRMHGSPYSVCPCSIYEIKLRITYYCYYYFWTFSDMKFDSFLSCMFRSCAHCNRRHRARGEMRTKERKKRTHWARERKTLLKRKQFESSNIRARSAWCTIAYRHSSIRRTPFRPRHSH